MKSKKFVYLLIGCVAIVWGMIIYRIYIGLNQDEENPVVINLPKTGSIQVSDHTADSYVLDLAYRDPFSSTEIAFVPEEKKESNTGIVKPVMPPVKPMISWPTIAYTGYISNPVTHQKIAMLTINGKASMVNEGDVQQGIKLVKNMGDSIQLSFQKNTRFIRLN